MNSDVVFCQQGCVCKGGVNMQNVVLATGVVLVML